MADVINVEILPDGTLKITTDRVSMANHGNAEALIRQLVSGAGGTATRVRKTGHAHTQEHSHEHDQ
jgi:hypothetical protein